MLTGRQQKTRAKITLRRATQISDYRDCEQAQRDAWQTDSQSDIVALHILRPLSEKGGLVINAYDEDERIVGTSIGFLAQHNGKPIFYSHMTGVVPDYQSKNVGWALKLEQREYALEQGFDLICWTYDPMQSVNSRFNLRKLGVIARTYYENYYGDMTDGLNKGLASDRFLVEWWIRSPRVQKRIEPSLPKSKESVAGLKVVNETTMKGRVMVPVGRVDLRAQDETVLVEIPYKYDDVRAVDPAFLPDWRRETRTAYNHCFGLGYIATDSIVIDSEIPRSYVKLERRPLERVLQD
jgi:predicted GNAT superfamily acetyltransferase